MKSKIAIEKSPEFLPGYRFVIHSFILAGDTISLILEQGSIQFMNELARKDLLTCLGIWLALEIVCFGLLAITGLARSQFNTEPWLVISLPLGIGGAFLIASSTRITETFRQPDRAQTRAMSLSGALLSWMGLVGIGFPILISSALIFVEIFARLRR